jgi:hypothetical protein
MSLPAHGKANPSEEISFSVDAMEPLREFIEGG